MVPMRQNAHHYSVSVNFLMVPTQQNAYSVERPYGLCGRKATLNLSELRSCVKVEVVVLGSPSLINLMVSVDVKQQ